MKRSTKITTLVITFFVIIAVVIGGRYAMKIHFQKKFGTRSPPAVIVVIVENKNFNQKIESYGTALSKKTNSFRIKKSELLKPISFNEKVEKGDVIVELKSGNIVAPFTGVLGKRGISENTLDSENLLILTLDDATTIFSDLKIPEIYARVLKKGLTIEAKFAAYKNKIYTGEIESVASRVDAQTRSILVRAKINNENLEIIPGSLLEIDVVYEEKNALSIPDTALLMEGNKKFVYKIIENNMIQKTEVKTGVRGQENIEVINGLALGDKVVAEGLMKVGPSMKIKPIIKSK